MNEGLSQSFQRCHTILVALFRSDFARASFGPTRGGVFVKYRRPDVIDPDVAV